MAGGTATSRGRADMVRKDYVGPSDRAITNTVAGALTPVTEEMMTMADALDVDLHDHETIDEIRLVTELMVVASMAPGELEQSVIDDALGVTASPNGFPAQRRPGVA